MEQEIQLLTMGPPLECELACSTTLTTGCDISLGCGLLTEIIVGLVWGTVYPVTAQNEFKNPGNVKPKAATIIGSWFKSETFWQGVAASTLSTGIITLGVVVAAFFTGLVDLKSAIVTLLSFVAVISVTAFLVWLIPAVRTGLDVVKSKVTLTEDAHVSPVGILISGFVSIAGLILTWFIGTF
jgi:hypothetical protein